MRLKKYGDCEKQLRKNNPGMHDSEVKRIMGEVNSPLARISTYKCMLRGNYSDKTVRSPYAGKKGRALLAADIEFICDESMGYLHKLCHIEDIVKYGKIMGSDE